MTRDLEGDFAAFVVADADGFVDPRDEDFAVADGAGARGGDDGLTAFSTISSATTVSSLTLGRRSTEYSRPR